MKKLLTTQALPLQVLILGAAAAAARGLLYLLAVDETGLLSRNHPISWLLWLICAAAVGLVLASVWKLKGSNRYADNFSPSTTAAAGCFVFAAGIVFTLVSGNSLQRVFLVRLWQLSGILAAAGLVWAGISRKQGKRPFLLTSAALCLFLALHMVSRYQPWSSNPQAQDWVFTLLATVGLTLCAYHQTAFGAGSGKRRLFLGVSLLTVFACCGALPFTEYAALYLCGGIWAYTGLCRVIPVPRRKPAPVQESPGKTE